MTDLEQAPVVAVGVEVEDGSGASGSIFDDEISPEAVMSYETIRGSTPPPKCTGSAILVQQAIVREGACHRRTIQELRKDAGPAWPIWLQFLFALCLVILIIVVIMVICAIWRYLVRRSLA